MSPRVYAFICWFMAIRVHVKGTPQNSANAVLFVPNHISYLDIVALGSILDARFVAKSEVAGWPLFGLLSKIQNTVFIRRTRSALEGAMHELAKILKSGISLIVFAEGTSTNGLAVKPFKPGLFDAVFEAGGGIMVQPVALTIQSIDGKAPMGDGPTRNMYAWWRPEDTLVPHLWAFACSKGTDVAVNFLPVLSPQEYADRKALAAAAHRAVSQVVEAAAPLG
ncbi:MAG: 1-acyl-sn-glycerol-3-phosphate acyltransferase [Alphaproteobacteria bacterium]|nr:1-acyl-sn-glycerol-3-phosphate acyltransferase [Alphaproteobacteria bacterium]